MDFSSAVDEILNIRQKCETLLKSIEDLTRQAEKVSNFYSNDGSWRDILIADLKQYGKSYTSDICERICNKRDIIDKNSRRAHLNTIRTTLGKLRNAGLIKSKKNGMRKLWYVE